MHTKTIISGEMPAEVKSSYDSMAFGWGSVLGGLTGYGYAAFWVISKIPAQPLFNIDPHAFTIGSLASAGTFVAGAAVVCRAAGKKIDNRYDYRYPDSRASAFQKAGFWASAATALLATSAYAYLHPVYPKPDAASPPAAALAATYKPG